ncbi:MAG: cytochrome d ubiquinol oxidase subunit II, partial [Polyangiaceae bacterium]|nr:cytochrome d ubiquinol oxidase subunit II [Polyangiaceae bacterium]
MIESLWFAFVAFLLIGYVVLDGFDLGAGILHLFIARSREEREQIVASIGPVWDGNEVWLITAGGTLFLAFPKLYAISFSGFYLPLILILWLLSFRALGIELRHHVHDPLWQDFWDVAFSLASLLLAAAYGMALGNVVRGITFDADGRFFAPFWTHFGVADPVGIVDYYTATVGVTAVVCLALHGALWISLRTAGGVEARAVKAIWPLYIATIALVIATTAVTLFVQPRVLENLGKYPIGAVFPLLAVGSLV